MPRISFNFRLFPVSAGQACLFMLSLSMFFLCAGCSERDDPEVVALIEKYVSPGNINSDYNCFLRVP